MISWLFREDMGCDKDSVRAFSELESKRLIAVQTNIDYYKKRMNEIQQEQAALTLQLQSLSASSTPNKTTPSKSEPYTHSTSPTKAIDGDEDEDDMCTYTSPLADTSDMHLQQLIIEKNKMYKELDSMEKIAKHADVTLKIEMMIVNSHDWFNNMESKMEKCRYDNAERQRAVEDVVRYRTQVLEALADGERLLSNERAWKDWPMYLFYNLERLESLRSRLLALDSTDKSH
jgi:hypothetical protein